MPGKRQKPALRAVVSEMEDGFVVSTSIVSDGNDIKLVVEEIAESLSQAEKVINKTAAKLQHRRGGVKLMYNLSDGMFTKFPKSRLLY